MKDEEALDGIGESAALFAIKYAPMIQNFSQRKEGE